MSSNNYAVVMPKVNITEYLEGWDWTRWYRLYTLSEEAWMPSLQEVEAGTQPSLGSWMQKFITSHRMHEMAAIDWGNGIKGLCVHDEHEQQCHYIVVS